MKMGTPRSMRPHKGAKKKVIAAAAEHETIRMAARTTRFNRHTMIAVGGSSFVSFGGGWAGLEVGVPGVGGV